MDKRILIDATTVNIARAGGGSFCVQAYIEALLRIYPNQVDVMHPKEAHIRDERYRTIDVPRRKRLDILRGGWQGYFHRGGKYVVDYILKNPNIYHTIFLNTGLFAGKIIEQLNNQSIRFVVLHHNFEPEYRIASRSILTLRGKTDKLVRYWEKKGYQNATINLFLTESDCHLFESEYSSHAHNYVTGVFEPTEEKQVCNPVQPTPTAVITCSLEDIQNHASIMHFIEQYMPLFVQVMPDWQVRLMGRNPSQQLIQTVTSTAQMAIYPNPVDIRSLAAESSIYLCPMEDGGGLKLRIMDGLRAGQPILVHERSSRGYEALMKMPFFKTYKDASSFAEQLHLLRDYIDAPTYSRQGVQASYYNLFGLEKGIERLKSILSNTIEC